MKDDIVWTCNYCHRIPSAQSLRKCPICGRKLTPWDRSKNPLERQPEWPYTENKQEKEVNENNRIDYSKLYNMRNPCKDED